MKKAIGFLVLLSMIFCMPAFGAFEWQLHDFGTGPFDYNNNWSPISYPYNIGNLPSPGFLGEGGEKFDIEGLNFSHNDGKINISLTNSFGLSAYSTSWKQNLRAGDIFFGFNGNKYEYGIDISENRLYKVSSYNGIEDKAGTYYGTSIEAQAGAWEIGSGTDLGLIDNSYTYWPDLELNPLQGSGDTYVFEFEFDASKIMDFNNYSSITFHNTLACGNDLLEKSYPAVPEPTTLLLFGLGSLGLAAYRRKRR